MRVFVQVVEQGSFSAAARENDSSVSSIARQVKALENYLGARLLNKTTRQQGLTEAGRVFFDRAKAILQDLDRAKRDVASFQSAVKGSLRVYLRTSVADAVIIPELPLFLQRYPELSIEVILGDERIDLVANGIDVAVWLGHLEDSSMIARRLSPSRRIVCGSPDYFRRFGTPKRPGDLVRHNCLLFTGNHYGNTWRFTRGAEKVEVPVTGNLQTSSGSVLRAAALRGLGVILSQEWMLEGAFKSGMLVGVLSDYDVSPTDFDTSLYAVYPHGRGLSAKSRVFVDFLVDLFGNRHRSAPAAAREKSSP